MALTACLPVSGDLVRVSMLSIQRPPATHLYLNKLDLSLNAANEKALHGNLWAISVRGCWEGFMIGFGLAFGHFGDDLKRQALF